MDSARYRRRRGGSGGACAGSVPPAGRRRRGWLKRVVILTLVLLIGFGMAGGGLLYSYAGELPSLDHVSPQGLAQSTKIYARDGTTLLDERFVERRTVVPLAAISWDLRHATIAIEDRDFYTHPGVNLARLLSAAVFDVLHRRAAQGASTITEQLVKNYVLTLSGSSRTLDRKVRELMLAIEMERRYTKNQILETYLNTILYGNQTYGVEAASQTYFGVSAKDLTLAQSSFLAGLPQRPSAFNPFRPNGFRLARLRQRDVLAAMVRDHYITSAQASRAYAVDLQAPIAVRAAASSAARSPLAPHFVDYVWDQLEQQYDPGFLLRGGLRVVTTLDPHAQQLAQQSVAAGVQRFSHTNRVNNGAMLVMSPHTGEILAMVGSADYFNADIGGQVNYTVAPRQPGSSFKPYTYVTALMSGWTPASPLDDSNGAHAFPGYPLHDWDSRELGIITLRRSLQESRNISSVHLFKDVGMGRVFATARALGITTPLDPSLPTTLGASPVSMTEHLAAYSAFANGGTRVRPLAILSVTSPDGTVLEHNAPKPDSGERVLPQDVTYVLTDILKGAVHPAVSVPVAAKSGTTSEFKDAWYIGYSTDLAVAAWIGRTVMKPQPANESMNYLWGETGPGWVWHQFLKNYYAGKPRPPDWTRPADIVPLTFCKQTGQPTDQTLPDLTITDIFIKPAPLAAFAPCGPASGAPAASPSPSPGPSPSPSPSPSPGPTGTPPVILPSIGPLASPSPTGLVP